MIGGLAMQACRIGEKLVRNSSSLAGRVAVVSGATKGIGYEIARRLGHNGAKVVVSSRKQHHVDEACQKLHNEGLDVLGMVCHVGQDDDRKNLVNKTLEKYGKIDILVPCAAVNPVYGEQTILVSEEAWDKVFEINVKSAFLLIKEVVPQMKEKKIKGVITLMSSISGYFPLKGMGTYTVSKAAIFALTKVLANELGGDEIRVNCIVPGLTKTDFSKVVWGDDSFRKEMIENTSLKRIGTPEDCAKLVAFLSSDDASFITGENIVISGGHPTRL